MNFQPASNALSAPLPIPTKGVFLPTPYNPPRVGTPTPGLEYPGGVPTLKPANDNRTPRHVQNWPTGKRLLQSGRYADHALLVTYRGLLDIAWGAPANDNWRNPAPAPGRADGRAMEEQICQRDMIFDEDSIEPSIGQLIELSGVPWGDDAAPRDQRPVLTRVDRAGMAWRRLGGLEFINGACLWSYGDLSGDRSRLRRPMEMRRPHRAKRSDPSIAVSTDGWSIEDKTGARDSVRIIWERLPASSVRILEHAIGCTKAAELGGAFGKIGKTAERFGVRLIDRAIDHLRDAVP